MELSCFSLEFSRALVAPSRETRQAHCRRRQWRERGATRAASVFRELPSRSVRFVSFARSLLCRVTGGEGVAVAVVTAVAAAAAAAAVCSRESR